MKGGKYIKTLAKNSGQKNIPCTRYSKKCFTQIYKDLYGDAMLVPTQVGTNMADGTNKNICYRVLVQKREFILFLEELINIKVILYVIHELFR